VREKKITQARMVKVATAAIMSMLLIYVFGVGHMMRALNMKLPQALAAGVVPFVAGDAIKLVVAIPLALKLRPVVARYLYAVDDASDDPDEESVLDNGHA
jgi:biotin transport system substrate-specific component